MVGKWLIGITAGAALAAAAACSSGATANGRTVSVSGCIARGDDGSYVLAPEAGPGGAVGTSGSRQQRYRLIDESNVGVARWVNRQARITGKVEATGQDGATPSATDVTATGTLPVLRVAQLNGGGDCTPAQ